MPFVSMLMIGGWATTMAIVGFCALNDSRTIGFRFSFEISRILLLRPELKR